MSAAVVATTAAAKPIMYWNKLCPFVHRSWIAALEKGADIELKYVSLSDFPDWYGKEVNSRETLPALKLPDGKILKESMYVAQYFDENYGIKGSLQAGSAVQKHQARIFLEKTGDVIGKLYGLLMNGGDKDEVKKAADAASEGLNGLEAALTKQSAEGPYFLGAEFTMADIAIVPFLDRFRATLKAYHDFDIFQGRPRLAKLMKAAESRGSVASTAQPATFYIAAYKSYAKTAPVVDFKGKLYYSEVCPFAARARLANIIKGSPFEEVEVPLPTPEWYKEINPAEQVPAIKLHDGTCLAESIPLVQFIDEYSTSSDEANNALPAGNNLQPTDPKAMYDTRFLLDEYNNSSESLWGAMSGAEEPCKTTVANLGYLNGYYQDQGKGPYFLGAKPTFADAVLLPWWVRIEALYEVHLSKHNGGKTFEASYPALAATVAAARADGRFNAVLKDKAHFVENAKKQ